MLADEMGEFDLVGVRFGSGDPVGGVFAGILEAELNVVETHIDPDLDRREADLFIRHGLPARGHLVRIGLGTIAAAIYGAASLVEAHPAARTDARWRACPWVAYDAPHEYFRSMAFLLAHLGDLRPRIRANRFSLQVEAIRAGAGLGILPCFVGDADQALVRLTAPVAELGADYCLLVHPDLRTVPRVRRLIDWVRMVFKEARPALQGLLQDRVSFASPSRRRSSAAGAARAPRDR